MINMAAMAADTLGRLLGDEFRNTFGSGHPERAERLASIGRISLECLARSDALYHTVEHTRHARRARHLARQISI
jgi:hypothetical protein